MGWCLSVWLGVHVTVCHFGRVEIGRSLTRTCTSLLCICTAKHGTRTFVHMGGQAAHLSAMLLAHIPGVVVVKFDAGKRRCAHVRSTVPVVPVV